MKRTILFVCPHGAAKSVLAAALFQQRADEQGLLLEAACAGTEADATVSPAVADWLSAAGLPVPDGPRQLTAEDLATAWRVVALGCDLHGQLPQDKLLDWADVPALSAGFAAGHAAIQAHVAALADELTAETRSA